MLTRRTLLHGVGTGIAIGVYSPAKLLASAIRTEGIGASELFIATPTGCEARVRRSYPPLLERFIAKLDPAQDSFLTEVYASDLERALKSWTTALCGASKEARIEPLVAILAPGLVAASPTPQSFTTVHSTDTLRVERGTFSVPNLSRALFLKAWLDRLNTLDQLDEAEFEIYGIQISATSSSLIETDIHYDFLGTTISGDREQWTGRWTIEWTRSGASPWLANRWTAHGETRARLAGAGFIDISANVLDRASPAAEQLAAGIDHWRTMLDAACGIDVYGNHGVAVGDIDGKGYDSIYVCQPSGLPNRLLRNKGDGTFEDITDSSGTGVLDGTASALFVDLTNGGRQDLLVIRSGGPMLFRNVGDGRFTLQQDAFRFARPPQGTFTSAAVADYDRDGLLDVYLCVYSYYQGLNQYQFPSPYYDAQNGPPNFLFRNRGDGTFEDVTVKSGMDVNNNRFSFAAEWCDYDEDGWPDLYVANDFGRKNLYRNNRNGTFTDVSHAAGVEDYGPGMSTCWLDYDGDGRQDLYVANMWLAEGKRITANEHFLPQAPEQVRALYRKHNAGNSMYRNNGQGKFEDKTIEAGTERGGWSWSCAAWDANNDGYPDLYVANGFISGPNSFDLQSFFWRQVAQRSSEASGAATDYEMAWNAVNELVRSDYSWSGYQRNVFYSNNGDGTFSDVSGVLGLDLRDDSRAFALSDFDGDGRLEFVLKNRTGPQLRVMRNNMKLSGSSLIVRLTGRKSNRDAIGAIVSVASRGRRQTKHLSAGSGFASQHTKELCFGLGDNHSPVAVEVRWPSGITTQHPNISVNQRVSLIEDVPEHRGEPYRETKAATQQTTDSAPQKSHASATTYTWLISPLYGPDLKLTAADGTLRSLREHRGKPTVLLFLNFSCGESVAQMELFQRGHESLATTGIAIFAVSVQMKEVKSPPPAGPIPLLRATEQQIAAWNIQHRYLFDRRNDLTFPASFLLNSDGAVVRVYHGLVQPRQVIEDSKAIPDTGDERIAKAMPFPGKYYGNPFVRDYFTYAIAFVEYGLLDEAKDALERTIQLNPQYAAAWFNLGTVYLNLKRYPEAQKALREAVRLNPNDADAWNNLGLIAGEHGDYDEALMDFRNSTRANPNHLNAVQNMMQIYQFQSRPADAQKALEEILKKAPENPDLHLGLAMALLGQNDVVGSKRELQTAIRLRPDFVDAINNLGTVLLQTGDTAGAMQEFERSRQIAPDFDRPVLNEAIIYQKRGLPEKGRALLQDFLSKHPENADIRSLLEKMGGPL